MNQAYARDYIIFSHTSPGITPRKYTREDLLNMRRMRARGWSVAEIAKYYCGRSSHVADMIKNKTPADYPDVESSFPTPPALPADQFTDEEAEQIYALAGRKTLTEIGDLFGCAPRTVREIIRRKAVRGPKPTLDKPPATRYTVING